MSIERCEREIETLAQLLLSGHTDIDGITRALVDWKTERSLIEQEAYRQFLDSKSQAGEQNGFKPIWLPRFPL